MPAGALPTYTPKSVPCPVGPLWCPSSPQTMSRSSGEAFAAAQAQVRQAAHAHQLSCSMGTGTYKPSSCCMLPAPLSPRKMHFVNFGATLIQLSCSLAIVRVVRYALGGYWRSPTCLAATPSYPWTCE